MKIILASQSPRRQEYLAKMGVKFDIIPAQKDEIVKPNLTFEEIAIDISAQKAYEIFEQTKDLGDRLVIGSDTTVVFDGEVMGKPKDEQDVRRMLKKLNGTHHQAYTGLCILIEKDKKITKHTAVDKIEVDFKQYSDELIEKYIATGEPFGKAGAYTIQGIGGAFLEKIEGHPASIIGFPVPRIVEIFIKENIDFLNF